MASPALCAMCVRSRASVASCREFTYCAHCWFRAGGLASRKKSVIITQANQCLCVICSGIVSSIQRCKRLSHAGNGLVLPGVLLRCTPQELDEEGPPGLVYATSGALTYRASDHKLCSEYHLSVACKAASNDVCERAALAGSLISVQKRAQPNRTASARSSAKPGINKTRQPKSLKRPTGNKAASRAKRNRKSKLSNSASSSGALSRSTRGQAAVQRTVTIGSKWMVKWGPGYGWYECEVRAHEPVGSALSLFV